jgi:hypothetical protein
MREKLPMTFCWMWWHEETVPDSRRQYRIEDATHSTFYRLMPVPIIYLRARFSCRFVWCKCDKRWGETLLCGLALAFVLPAFLAIGLGTLPAKQKVRLGSDPSAFLWSPMEGRIAASE